MHDPRDDYEPIIATRPSREPPRQETQPLWLVVLALLGGLAVVVLLAWWWMGRAAPDDASMGAQSESAASETFPETQVEQEVLPSARDADQSAERPQEHAPPTPAVEPEPESGSEPSVASESLPEVVPEDEDEPTAPPAPLPVSVRFVSPDPQVRIELYRPFDASPVLTSKVGDVVDVEPGTYRVLASGAGLEPFEQEVMFDGERPLEYAVELCTERSYTRESVVGQVVEERTCTSTEECESLFMILSEYANELVRDRDFLTQQCARWRPNAAPDGSWTLNINCDGATPVTTCGIVVAGGACTYAEPRRSARGASCPRATIE